MKELKIVILGSLNWLNECLKELHSKKIKPAKVFLPNDRNNQESLKILKKLKIDFEILESINSNTKKLAKLKPDLVLCFAFPEILNKKVLSIAKFGNINFHSSDLPRFRGRHPVNWAMIKGEKTVGICAHFMNEKIDLGDVILRDYVFVKRDDRILDVMSKLTNKMKKMAVTVIKQVSSNCLYTSTQNLSLSSYDKKREEKDSKINWNHRTLEIHRFINALSNPYPNAFCKKKDKSEIVKFSESTIGETIGQVVAETLDGRVLVSAKDGVLLLKANKKLKVGDILE